MDARKKIGKVASTGPGPIFSLSVRSPKKTIVAFLGCSEPTKEFSRLEMDVAVSISAKKRISCEDDSENEAPENSHSTSAPSPSVKAARVSLGNVTSGQKQPLADGCPNVVPAAANVVIASTEYCSHSIAGKSAEVILSNKK